MGGTRPKVVGTVAVSYSIGSDDSFPCLVGLNNTSVKVASKKELVHLWNSGDEGIQFFIELLLSVVWVCNGGSVALMRVVDLFLPRGNFSFIR